MTEMKEGSELKAGDRLKNIMGCEFDTITGIKPYPDFEKIFNYGFGARIAIFATGKEMTIPDNIVYEVQNDKV